MQIFVSLLSINTKLETKKKKKQTNKQTNKTKQNKIRNNASWLALLIPRLFKTKQTLSRGTSKMETVPL